MRQLRFGTYPRLGVSQTKADSDLRLEVVWRIPICFCRRPTEKVGVDRIQVEPALILWVAGATQCSLSGDHALCTTRDNREHWAN